MERTVVFALPALLPSLSSHDFITCIYLFTTYFVPNGFKELTKTDYGRIKIEKEKVGETRKEKAGDEGSGKCGGVGERKRRKKRRKDEIRAKRKMWWGNTTKPGVMAKPKWHAIRRVKEERLFASFLVHLVMCAHQKRPVVMCCS